MLYKGAGGQYFIQGSAYFVPAPDLAYPLTKGNFIALNNKNTLKKGSTVYAQVDTYLNVRSVPNSNGEIIAKAYPKDALNVLEVLEGWVKVALNGKEGYVSSEFVK